MIDGNSGGFQKSHHKLTSHTPPRRDICTPRIVRRSEIGQNDPETDSRQQMQCALQTVMALYVFEDNCSRAKWLKSCSRNSLESIPARAPVPGRLSSDVYYQAQTQ